MIIQFDIPVRTFSINEMFCANRTLKTQKFRDWVSHICHAIQEESIQEMFQQFHDHFDPKKHVIEVDFVASYPNLFTKKDGSLSSKVHDLSNWEKPLIDVLFLKYYHEREFPFGCPNLNIDDRYIQRLSSRKETGEHNINVSISCNPIAP